MIDRPQDSPEADQLVPEDPNLALYQSVLRGRERLDHVTDPRYRRMMELAQSAMETVAIGIHDLHELPSEERLSAFDSVVDRVFDEDPAAQATLARIRTARDRGDTETSGKLVAVQKARYNNLRKELSLIMGIDIQDVEAENTEYRQRIFDIVAQSNARNDEEIMLALEFLVPDEESGKLKFAFPKELFPPHIKEEWDIYQRMVAEHQKTSAAFDRALSDDSAKITQLDMIRRFAHNNLARSVRDFLQLDGWDLDKCRKFITKMIEQKFPTVNTDESALTSRAVLAHFRAVQVLDSTVHHNNDRVS